MGRIGEAGKNRGGRESMCVPFVFSGVAFVNINGRMGKTNYRRGLWESIWMSDITRRNKT